MELIEVREEYIKARRLAQKETRERRLTGKPTEPAVLDEILGEGFAGNVVDLGIVNIPVERIVGTKSAGRIMAFSAGFLPMLGSETEFAQKWIHLCKSHLSDEGIRSPIVCYE